MAKITDPDYLSQGSNNPISGSTGTTVQYNTSAKTITLIATGNLSASDGVTLQALYSFTKESWKTDSTLIKFPFPFIAITEQKFDLVNGWNFVTGATREYIRDAGWAYKDTSNNSIQEYMGVVTLGSVGTNDQIYYQQNGNSGSTNVVLSGAVNQAVLIYNSGSTITNYRDFFKIFTREQGKTYDQSNLSAIGQTNVTYQVYSFPLGNSTDTKISNSDSTIDTTSPYTAMSINYLVGSGYTNWVSGTSYGQNYVVKNTNDNRWYRALSSHTSTGSTLSASSTLWTTYLGERSIGGTYYAFNVIISGNSGSKTQIYEFVQRQLRKSTNINSGLVGPAYGNVSGKTANELLEFVGDTLVTSTGVYIDNFSLSDTNSLQFYDVGGTQRTFPFVATGTITFNENLTNDASAIYRMFFTTNPSGNFGTSSAITVNNNSGVPITGSCSGLTSVSFDFDYDNNVQGGRTAATDADVTVVAIGLSTGQYVKTTGTISRSNSNSVSLVAALERNYSNT